MTHDPQFLFIIIIVVCFSKCSFPNSRLEPENHNGNEIENHVLNFHCMILSWFSCVCVYMTENMSHVQKDSRRTLSQAHFFEWPKFTVGLGDGSMVNFI